MDPQRPACKASVPVEPWVGPDRLIVDLERARQQLQTAWQGLQRLGQEGAVDHSPGEEFRAQLKEMLPDPDDFRPGRLGPHAPIWREYFTLANRGKALSGAQKTLLQHLEGGIKLEWVPVDHPAQQLVPDRERKLDIVRPMLQLAVPGCDPDGMLAGDRPQPVVFPNHRSATQHSEFVTAEIHKCVECGVIREWPADGPPPTVVNGVLVVEKDGKRRMCINPMYVNAKLRHRGVKYERLSDVRDYLTPEDWLYTTDDKSGYWQLPLHLSEWTYFAMQWQGRTYYWPHLPFGVAPACHLYTTLKLEVFRPLRELGVRMSFLIDDQMGAAPSKAAAQFQCKAVVGLLAALGFTLSLSTCQLEPRLVVRFLGMEVDAGAQAFKVPEDKITAFSELLDRLTGQPLTARQAAQVAGKIVAMMLAVTTAPLYTRLVLRVA